MAATKRNAMLIAEAREKIRTTQLVNRLQNHALGDLEMTPTQIKATEILLRKAIPDLASVTVAGDPEGVPIEMSLALKQQQARRLLDEAFAEPERKE